MPVQTWLLLLLSAGLQVLAFPSANFTVLSWIAFVPWLVVLLRPEPAPRLSRTFAAGWLAGALWYLGTCYWIYISMRLHGDLGVAAAGLVLFLFCLYLGLYHAAFALAVVWLRRRIPTLALILAVPLAWVALELARSRITAFPWDLLGYTQVDNAILQPLAPYLGVYGLSFVVMLVNAAIAVGAIERRVGVVILGAVLGAVLQTGTSLQTAPQTADKVAVLVQQNLPLESPEAWNRSYFDSTIATLVQVSEPAGFREKPGDKLIIWPESPAPFYLGDAAFLRWMTTLADDAHSYVIAGAVGTDAPLRPSSQSNDQAIYNSAALFSPDGRLVRRYDKVHLVPFGEYVPLVEYLEFAKDLTRQVGAFTHGSRRTLLEADKIRVGTFICYESVFPDEVRQFTKLGANVLVNISNDGWFGHSAAALQHLRMVRMRAIENRRWILRATNSGITSVIDPHGQVTQQLPIDERSALIARYALSNEEQTFYTRNGDWFAFACAILSVGAALAPRFRRTSQHG